MSRLPDLEAWAIFAKVAETGSFARAAAELSLSQATVSKAVSRLEGRMKTVLFHRTSRRISLTESGLAALERASRILEEGEAVEAEVTEQSSSPRGPIRMTAPMSFGISHVAPVLPPFMARYPEVTLDVHFSDEQVDLVEKRFDLALRISTLADSSLLVRRLCTVRILLVGSPAYFEQHGRPRHPRELAQHRALQYAYARTGSSWRFRHARHGEFTQAMPTPLRVNNAEALTPALRAGAGLALQPEFLAWQDLQSGALETVMDDWQVEPIALHLVTPPGRGRPARVQALMEYLAAHFIGEPWARAIDA
ncbi:LysR family transcriptional regulator [Pigmentiphaga sp.]|uniref:LysR family transcriptional regulator n=1 Tax=Pigmentiphaga sp. TaxID=1977564 RepID=UPI00128D48C1|nr:LysR family transcriptional regulator [Pigmentiphaga sp.]MPS28053.1 LysR family transcriptional regulator [Alcaligenaceae bacterium SAGV5]MPS54610.1 LysR family transcriptional regulator [Alcaligenaceae bacterium SAGV3]MPT57017.1 LysR family transcriptional regulator [Alcaligenaceae bacterium]